MIARISANINNKLMGAVVMRKFGLGLVHASFLALISFSGVWTTSSFAWEDNPFRTGTSNVANFPMRQWTDDSGKNNINARYLSSTTTTVTLHDTDGRKITVPLKRLSPRDQGYVEGVNAAGKLASAPQNGIRREATDQPRIPPRQPPEIEKPLPPREQPISSFDAVAAAEAMQAIEPYTGEDKVIELPDTVGNVVPAAAGRLLLLHLPKTKKVAVYDVNEAKVVKYLSLASETAVIIGGLSKMIVLEPNQGVIERWSLQTYKKETTRPVPFEGVFKTMAMGHACDGPLLIHWAASTDALARAEYQLFDLQNFKSYGLEFRGRNTSYRDAVHIRAAATGDVFGLWATSHSPQGMEVLRLVGREMKSSYQHTSVGHVVPSYDGRSILTGLGGLNTPELNQKIDFRKKRVPLAPTSHPRFYVTVPADPGAAVNLGSKPFDGVSPTLHVDNIESRLVTLPSFQLGSPAERQSWNRSDFTLDKRVHYVVQANQLITVPYTNDRIVIQRFDCRAEMDKAGVDYLFVTSVPSPVAARGKIYRYQVEVAASQGVSGFEVSSGPDGMKVDDQGLIEWPVPRDFTEQDVTVIVTITSKDGQSIYETFKIECPEARPVSSAPGDRRASSDTDRHKRLLELARQRIEANKSKPPAAAPPTRSGELASRAPADFGLGISINPEGIFRPSVPDPEFSSRGAALRPPGQGLSPARARLRIKNHSRKTIRRLVIAAINDYPPLMTRTVNVDALRGVGQLAPGETVEVIANWRLLPNARLSGGAAGIKIEVADIGY